MKNIFALVSRSIVAILPLTLAAASAAAQGVTVLSDFGQTPTAGEYPNSPLIFDKAGNLYGVTGLGGETNEGTVFELTKKPDGLWTRKTLHIFLGCAHGCYPAEGALAFDAAGNLYGTTEFGGARNDGVLYELSPSGNGSWTETVLGNAGVLGWELGFGPGVIADSAGNLYGTTTGFYGYATIFEMKRTATSWGNGWYRSAIHSFSGEDGQPTSVLTMDRDGNLYGTTFHLYGDESATVFRLSKPGQDGGEWGYTVLHRFPGLNANGTFPNGDGAVPQSGVILDAYGNLYGITTFGGAYNHGAVFEVPAGQSPDGPDKILYSFHSASMDNGGQYPVGGLVFDASGNLYGTTQTGGIYGGGKIFELLPNGDGTWTAKDLHDFGGFTYNGFPAIDGINPDASMTLGADGNLYGTTGGGGYHPGDPSNIGGVAFELKLH
jgi:uncharacterized repeat protein (TIGR03803 family)